MTEILLGLPGHKGKIAAALGLFIPDGLRCFDLRQLVYSLSNYFDEGVVDIATGHAMARTHDHFFLRRVFESSIYRLLRSLDDGFLRLDLLEHLLKPVNLRVLPNQFMLAQRENCFEACDSNWLP